MLLGGICIHYECMGGQMGRCPFQSQRFLHGGSHDWLDVLLHGTPYDARRSNALWAYSSGPLLCFDSYSGICDRDSVPSWDDSSSFDGDSYEQACGEAAQFHFSFTGSNYPDAAEGDHYYEGLSCIDLKDMQLNTGR